VENVKDMMEGPYQGNQHVQKQQQQEQEQQEQQQ
jgi:hypothetical protein